MILTFFGDFYHFWPFWPFWTILDHFGPFGTIWNHFGPFWTILTILTVFYCFWLFSFSIFLKFLIQNCSGSFDTSGSMLPRLVHEILILGAFCDTGAGIGDSRSWMLIFISIRYQYQSRPIAANVLDFWIGHKTGGVSISISMKISILNNIDIDNNPLSISTTPNCCGYLGFLDQTGWVKYIHSNINSNINIEQCWYWYQYDININPAQ